MAEGYDPTRFRSTIEGSKCCICFGVLKYPMPCENNKHYFCSRCIEEYMEKTSHSCPVCEKLTVETFSEAPIIFGDSLSRYKINCDKKHVENCEFTPVSYSNKGCNDVVNKRDVKRHELDLCRFKAATCVVCGKKMPQHEYDAHGCVLRRDLNEEATRDTQHELVNGVSQMAVSLENLEKSCGNVGDVPDTRNIDIVVIGGMGHESEILSTVERFNLFDETWTPLGELEIGRLSSAAVLFQNQIIVCGGAISSSLGDSTDTIEVLDLKGNAKKWEKFAANMPIKVAGHQCVVHGNNLLIFGGSTADSTTLDTIYELLLVPPYSSKLLGHMKKKRVLPGVELFEDKVLIAGGLNDEKEVESSVEIFDIPKNECIEMPPLPSPVYVMATVRRGDNMLLIGGQGEEGIIVEEIVEYDHKTGQSRFLTSMETNESCCCAVCHEDKLFVFGAVVDDDDVVYCFNFLSNSWNRLPSMAEPRMAASAVIVEKKIIYF